MDILSFIYAGQCYLCFLYVLVLQPSGGPQTRDVTLGALKAMLH